LAILDRIDLKLSKTGNFSHLDSIPTVGDGSFFEVANFIDADFGQAQVVVVPGGQGHAASSVIKCISGTNDVNPTRIKFNFNLPYAGSPYIAFRVKKAGSNPRGAFSASAPNDPFANMEYMPNMAGDSFWFQKRIAPVVNSNSDIYINVGFDDIGGDVIIINGQSLVGDFELDVIYIGFEPLMVSGAFATNVSGNWWSANEQSSSSPYKTSKIKEKIQYNYSTIHLVSLAVDGSYQRGMGSWCSLDDDRIEGWRQFLMKDSAPSLPNGPDVSSFIIPMISPDAAGKNFIWEQSAASPLLVNASILNPGSNFNQSVSYGGSLSVRCYRKRNFIENGYITTPEPISQLMSIKTLNAASLNAQYKNAEYFNTDGGVGVRLELPQRVVGILMDQSGSMSWNDPDNTRFSIANDIVDRFQGGYPGDVSFAISSFSGVPINIDWFAALEKDVDNAGNPSSAQAVYSLSSSHNFSGVQIVRKAGSVPSSPSDGEIIFDGYSSVVFDSGLDSSQTYHYSIYPKDRYGRTYDPSVISIKPDAEAVPFGIKSIVGKELKGTGIQRSSSTIASWHMNEGYGSRSYNFVSNLSHLLLSTSNTNFPPTWIDRTDSPLPKSDAQTGKGSGVRLNGKHQWLECSNVIPHAGNKLTFSIWAYPLIQSNTAIIGGPIASWTWGSSACLLRVIPSSNIVEFTINGKIFNSSYECNGNRWNCIFVSIDRVSGSIVLSVNGGSTVYSNQPTGNGNNISSFTLGKSGGNFGAYRITECSMHGTVFDNSFIQYNSENISTDNGDRIIVISNPNGQLVGSDGNKLLIKYKKENGPLRLLDQNISGPANVGRYGGDSAAPQNVPIPPGPFNAARSDVSARICFGDDLGPVSMDDGDTIYDSELDGIRDELVVHGPFGLPLSIKERGNIEYSGFRHYFRAFTVNTQDEYSLVEDSGMIEYQPSMPEDFVPQSVISDEVSNVNALGGDRKTHLTWSLPISSEHDSVLVYYNKPLSQDAVVDYADLDDFISRGFGAYPVFCGLADATSFTHFYGRVSASTPLRGEAVDAVQTLASGIDTSMELENGKLAHYAIVLRNADGSKGNPIFVSISPNAAEDAAIPTENIIGLRSYKLEKGSVSIKFINPINPKLFYDVGGWFDDRVFFYFKITDIYGRPLEDQFDFVFRTSYDISSAPSDYIDTPSSLLIVDDGTADGITDSTYSYKTFDPISAAPAKINFKFSDLCRFSRRNASDGYVRVTLDTDAIGPDKLKFISGLYFSARMSIRRRRSRDNLIASDTSSPIFAFDTQPIRLWLSNPFKVEVETPDQTIVPCAVNESASSISNFYDCGAGSSSDSTASVYNGAYVGRSKPITFIFKAKYKDGPMPEGSSATLIAFRDELPYWSSVDGNGRCSMPAGYRGCVQFNGENGTPRETRCTGQIAGDPVFGEDFTRSYVVSSSIVPKISNVTFTYNEESGYSEAAFTFTAPKSATAATIFGHTSVGGLSASAGAYFAFPDPLYISIDAQAPVPDGIDVARQVAYAAVIDPNRAIVVDGQIPEQSTLESFTVPVPDGTVVDWEISPLRNGKNRPFYSIAYSNSSNVRDFTVGGYSSNIRFGPASNVSSELLQETVYGSDGADTRVVLVPEMYVIRASIVINNKRASAWKVVCIYPPALSAGGTGNPASQLVRKTGMFCSLVNGRYSQRLYSDGIDFAIFQISKDARISMNDSSSVDERTMASAFVKCYNGLNGENAGMEGAFLSTLSDGQIVRVRVGKLQDYHANNNTPYWLRNIEILDGSISISKVDGREVVSSARSANDDSYINLSSGNKTYFAIRSNGFIPKLWDRHNEPTTVKDVGYLCSDFHQRPYAAAGEDVDRSNPDAPVFPESNIGCSSDGFIETCNYDYQVVSSANDKRWLDYDVVIGAETTVSSQYGDIPCVGAGEWSLGNPPKLIKFVEPLSIVFAFNEVGGQRYFDGRFVVDGSSRNRLYFAVSFSGRPVPDGTPVYVYICGNSSMSVSSTTVFTQLYNENGSWCVDANGNFINSGTSYAVVDVDPVVSGSNINNTIYAEVKYDKLGNVFRQIVCGVNVIYNGNSSGSTASFTSPPGGGSGGNDQAALPTILKDPLSSRDFVKIPLSNQCFRYDNSPGPGDARYVRIADMSVPRSWHVSEYVNGKYYVFGGISSFGICSLSEYWTPSENRWMSAAPMPTPRFGCCSVNDGRYIYVIGGVESYVDISGGNSPGVRYSLKASGKIERYDTVLDEWTAMSSMPWIDADGNVVDSPVGEFDSLNSNISQIACAFGAAFIVGTSIYVMCGARTLNSNLEPVEFLDRAVKFNILNNQWRLYKRLSGSELQSYSRLYPNFALKLENSTVVVFGGSGYRQETEQFILNGSIQTRTVNRQFNFTSGFAFSYTQSLNSDYIGGSDVLMPNMPVVRDQAMQVKFGFDYFVFGGRILPTQSTPGTPAYAKVQKLKYSLFDYTPENMDNIPFGRALSGIAGDGNRFAVISGGVESGKSPGFVRIYLEVYGEQNDTVGFTRIDLQEPVNAMLRLDGISGADIKIKCYDENGSLLSGNVNVRLTGFVKFPISDEQGTGGSLGSVFGRNGPGADASFMRKRIRRGTKVFPVRFSQDVVNIVDGIGSSRMLGRSEDPLRDIAEISAALGDTLASEIDLTGDMSNQTILRQNLSRYPYQVVVYAEIEDTNLYGNTSFIGTRTYEDQVIYPELNDQDEIFDDGEFDFSNPMPAFSPGYGGLNATNQDVVPLPFVGLGNVLQTTQVGVIGPVSDSDIFSFTAPVDGEYTIAVTNRGISTLRSRIQIFSSNREPLSSDVMPDGIIDFSLGDGVGDPTNIVYLQKDALYYVVVKSSTTSQSPNAEEMPYAVGEYRIRIAVPYEEINNTSSSLIVDPNIPGESFVQGNFTAGSPCPFICPSCIRTGSGMSGLSCTGSNNTYCVNMVGVSALNFTGNNNSQNPSFVDPGNGDGTFVGSGGDAFLGQAQAPESIPELLDFIAIDMNNIFSYWSGGSVILTEPESPIVQYYSDMSWLPQVRTRIFTGSNAYAEAKEELNLLARTVPFGCSPIFDAISESTATMLSDFDSDSIRKSFILISDGDENVSRLGVEDAVDEINGLRGERQSPLIMALLSLYEPRFISSALSKANVGDAVICASSTGGGTSIIRSFSDVSRFVDFSMTRSAGAFGNCQWEAIIDLDRLGVVIQIVPYFEVPSGTSASFSVEFSTDKDNWSDKQSASHNLTVSGPAKLVRYIKFTAVMSHPLVDVNVDENGDSAPEYPSLRMIDISVSYGAESSIVTKPFNIGGSPNQVVVSVVTEKNNVASVHGTASSHIGYDFEDYAVRYHKVVDDHGKIVFGQRKYDVNKALHDVLTKKHGLWYESPRGGWFSGSSTVLRDGDGNIVPVSKYIAIPRIGAIILKMYVKEPLTIEVVPNKELSIAVNIINPIISSPVKVGGIAYMATSNADVDGGSINQPPLVIDLSILNSPISVYETVSCLYTYLDPEGDEEDIGKTEIRWYINDIEAEFLRNYRKFNDFNDPDDPIFTYVLSRNYAREGALIGQPGALLAALDNAAFLKIGDRIRFSVKPHDGIQFGNEARSQQYTVIDTTSTPLPPVLRARNMQTQEVSDTATNNTSLFLDFELFASALMNSASVRWYLSLPGSNEIMIRERPLVGSISFPSTYIYPNERLSNNQRIISIGNIIRAEIIIPATSSSNAVVLSSNSVIITNIVPRVSVSIAGLIGAGGGSSPSGVFTVVQCDYIFSDLDIDNGENQSDQSLRYYEIQVPGAIEYSIVENVDPKIDVLNVTNYVAGTKIRVRVIPYDGVTFGITAFSNELIKP